MSFATGQTYWDALLPSLLLVLFAVAIFPWLNRDRMLVRLVVGGICLLITWRYLIWRIVETLPPFGLTFDFVIGIIFLTLETLYIVGTTASWIFLTRIRSRTPDADRNLPWLEAMPRKPRIDVLICTYNEDEKILERTIVGAQALQYENFHVWICDDGRRPWLEALCRRLQCGYLTRPDNAHAKAGNINSALRYLATLPEPPDFISILDADFVPQLQFLRRTLALMKDESVGVVQTPQHFFNSDPIQSNLAIADVWPDEQRFFFDVVMASKDAWGGAFCCGTSSLIRFDALIKIGGFPTDSVTEDYLLTLRLKGQGFKTIYLNERLSLGLAPEGLKEYVTQRSRWCLGFMQIIRGSSGPLRKGNGLSLLDRIMLVEGFLNWSAAYPYRLLGMIIPAIYLLFDIQAVHAHVTDAISHVFPYYVAQVAFIVWLTRRRVLPLLADLSQLLCAVEIVRSVVAGLVKAKGHKFEVTAKGGDRSNQFVEWPMLRLFLCFIGFTAAGIVWAFVIDDTRPLADASVLALYWSWYNLLVLTLACFVTIEAQQRRDGARLQAPDVCWVAAGDQNLRFRVYDLSITGIAFHGESPVPCAGMVTVRLGDMDVVGSVVRASAGSFAVRFAHNEQSHVHLIRYVYSGRYKATTEDIKPAGVAVGILSRLYR